MSRRERSPRRSKAGSAGQDIHGYWGTLRGNRCVEVKPRVQCNQASPEFKEGSQAEDTNEGPFSHKWNLCRELGWGPLGREEHSRRRDGPWVRIVISYWTVQVSTHSWYYSLSVISFTNIFPIFCLLLIHFFKNISDISVQKQLCNKIHRSFPLWLLPWLLRIKSQVTRGQTLGFYFYVCLFEWTLIKSEFVLVCVEVIRWYLFKRFVKFPNTIFKLQLVCAVFTHYTSLGHFQFQALKLSWWWWESCHLVFTMILHIGISMCLQENT